MDYAAVVSVVQSVGFPIVMCFAMGWYIYDSSKRHEGEISRLNEAHTQEISRLNDLHDKEMNSVTEAVHNNTVALEKLCTLMEREVNQREN